MYLNVCKCIIMHITNNVAIIIIVIYRNKLHSYSGDRDGPAIRFRLNEIALFSPIIVQFPYKIE